MRGPGTLAKTVSGPRWEPHTINNMEAAPGTGTQAMARNPSKNCGGPQAGPRDPCKNCGLTGGGTQAGPRILKQNQVGQATPYTLQKFTKQCNGLSYKYEKAAWSDCRSPENNERFPRGSSELCMAGGEAAPAPVLELLGTGPALLRGL